jgi:hypothetical protein
MMGVRVFEAVGKAEVDRAAASVAEQVPAWTAAMRSFATQIWRKQAKTAPRWPAATTDAKLPRLPKNAAHNLLQCSRLLKE